MASSTTDVSFYAAQNNPYHPQFQFQFKKKNLLKIIILIIRCDLIRFIVGVIHPTNELLCSDIIPRWAVIGQLLKKFQW